MGKIDINALGSLDSKSASRISTYNVVAAQACDLKIGFQII